MDSPYIPDCSLGNYQQGGLWCILVLWCVGHRPMALKLTAMVGVYIFVTRAFCVRSRKTRSQCPERLFLLFYE
jgi:hypothetical protein